MTLAKILKEKANNKIALLEENNLKNKKLPLGLIRLKKDLINEVLIDALKILPGNFIIDFNETKFSQNSNIAFNIDKTTNSGFDFIVCNDCEENINEILKSGIVPIIFKDHHMSSVLQEFNAGKIEGNAYIYENNSLCDIYYAIIRYLENYKFPYDNKALVKNILDI